MNCFICYVENRVVWLNAEYLSQLCDYHEDDGSCASLAPDWDRTTERATAETVWRPAMVKPPLTKDANCSVHRKAAKTRARHCEVNGMIHLMDFEAFVESELTPPLYEKEEAFVVPFALRSEVESSGQPSSIRFGEKWALDGIQCNKVRLSLIKVSPPVS
jgi:hypothetical protein